MMPSASRPAQPNQARSFAALTRLYRLLLRLYPGPFRQEFGDEMVAVFSDHLAETAAQGRLSLLQVGGSELAGLLGQGLRERLLALQSQPARLAQTSSGPRLWAGARRRFGCVHLLLALLVLGVLAVPLLSAAWQAAWERLENTPRVNQVALADLNGDGHLDAFLAAGRGNMPFPTYALYNDSAGGFADGAQDIGTWPGFSVVLGDVNGDGRADALMDITAGSIVRFLNNGGRPQYNRFLKDDFLPGADPGPRGVMRLVPALGDLNGDGRLDVFAAGCCGRPSDSSVPPLDSYQPSYSQVWLQTPEGKLKVGQRVGAAPSRAAALADLNGDGSLDVFLANGQALAEDWERGPNAPNTVWFNDGAGAFADSGQQLGQAESLAVALGDLNGDGFLDAAVGNTGPDEIWLNDGHGFFTDSGQRLQDGATEFVFLADLDRDGDLDLFAAAEEVGRAWLNDGSGQFTLSPQRVRFSADEAVALGDLTGDGSPDIFVAGAAAYRLYRNDGDGRFTAGPRTAYTTAP